MQPTTLSQQIQSIHPWAAWVIVGFALLAWLFFLKTVIRYLRLCLVMLRSKPVKIAAAQPGYCELSGKAEAVGKLLKAPLSGQPCLYYRYTIKERTRSRRSDRIRLVEEGSSQQYFLLNDESGQCFVDLTAVNEALLPTIKWYGKTDSGKGAPDYPGMASQKRKSHQKIEKISRRHAKYCFEERIIPLNQALYVQGQVEEVIDKPGGLKAMYQEKEKFIDTLDDKIGLSVTIVADYEKETNQRIKQKETAWQACLKLAKKSGIQTLKVVSAFGANKGQPLLVSNRTEKGLLKHCVWKGLINLLGLIVSAVVLGGFVSIKWFS